MSIKTTTKITMSLFVQGLVGALCFLMIAPPALLAQTMGGPTPSPFGAMPGTTGASTSGQAIVTNPNALQPVVPAQIPCPSPEPTEELKLPKGLTLTLNEFWPMETSAILPSSIEQRMRQEKEEREDKFEKERLEKERRELERERAQQELLQPGGLSGSSMGLSGTAQAGGVAPGAVGSPSMGSQGDFKRQQPPEEIRPKDFTLEEAFSQFSVLQGVKRRLKQFGYEFFDVQASGFAPVLDVPVGPDYVIGPQDSLTVHVWNVPDQNFNRSYIVPVERDGMMVIPQVGAIPVGGLTFSQAERAIQSRLSALLKRFEVHVAMARLRTIKVYVVGEVVRPGAYEISSLATVSNAVYAACGPAKSGSLRQIRVIRDGKTVADLDFYDFLLAGDRSQDRRLQAGDVVMVPPLGPVAAIGGAVKRPAIYELKPGNRLTDLLYLAGGLTPVADQRRCHIFRMESGQGRVMKDVDLATILHPAGPNQKVSEPGGAGPIIQDGDYVRISSLPTQVANVVSLAGAVKSPGPYEYRPGMRVKDLLTRDQMTVDAYVDRAEIIRTDLVNYQSKVIQFSPKELLNGSASENHLLQRLDQVVVASQLRPPMLVQLEGEVKRPGYYTIEVGERLSSLLKRTGGFTQNAFPQGIVLIRESVKRRQQAELDKFIAAERQRLTAQSAGIAAGTAGIAGGAALTTSGSIAEQQVLGLRLQQLEAVVSRIELGRVVVKLESLERLEGTEDDIRLEARDKISIPQPPQTVSIIGSVKNPSNVVHRDGLRLEDYLQQAGGPTEEANTKELYIMRANGTTESAYLRVKEIQERVPELVEN